MESQKPNVSDFLESLGGELTITIETGARQSAQAEWRRRNQIPPRYYDIFDTLARCRGVECPREIFGWAERAGGP